MAITITRKNEQDEASEPMFGLHDYVEYSGQVTFIGLVFESLTGRVPSEQELKLFNLILNLGFDNGPGSPSASATIGATKEGQSMGPAVAAGVSQLNEKHGGAGEPLMEILYSLKSQESSVKEIVEEYKTEGKRMPGFGHRIYKDIDPRAKILMDTAKENKVGVEYLDLLETLHQELNQQLGKNLPINVDGAIAAVFCGLGLEPKMGLAVYIIARTPGLIAHFLNTQS